MCKYSEAKGRKARYITFACIPGSVRRPVRQLYNPVPSKEQAPDHCNRASGYCGKEMTP